MMGSNPLFCVVCGFERGGTTLVSQLIRQHPDIDGRFECGFLLVDEITGFAELDVYVRNLKAGWGLSDESLNYILQASSYSDAYQRLVERSNLPDKNILIFDKTPRYMEILPRVLGKVDVPCVCVVRDPRGLYWSAQKHWNHDMLVLGRIQRLYDLSKKLPLKITCHWLTSFFKFRSNVNRINLFSDYYLNYANGWLEANRLFPDRILLVRFEALCTNPEKETKRLYNFLGLEFKSEYLEFPTTPDAIVDRGGILKDPIYEYQGKLSKRDQKRLLRKTSKFNEWHWHV